MEVYTLTGMLMSFDAHAVDGFDSLLLPRAYMWCVLPQPTANL